jgi:cell division protein FtsL
MSWLPTLDRSWFRSRLVLVAILLLLLVAASLVGDRGLLRLYQLHQTRAALIREIEQVSAANVVLAEEVRALRTDPARIEAIAREELGLVKPGETVYEFRAATPPQPSADAR